MSLSIEEQVKRIGKIMNDDREFPEGNFPYGRYKYEPIHIIAKRDREYVEWAILENAFGATMTKKLEKTLEILDRGIQCH